MEVFLSYVRLPYLLVKVDFKSCLVNKRFLPKKVKNAAKAIRMVQNGCSYSGAKKADWLTKLRKKRHRIASEHARYFSFEKIQYGGRVVVVLAR